MRTRRTRLVSAACRPLRPSSDRWSRTRSRPCFARATARMPPCPPGSGPRPPSSVASAACPDAGTTPEASQEVDHGLQTLKVVGSGTVRSRPSHSALSWNVLVGGCKCNARASEQVQDGHVTVEFAEESHRRGSARPQGRWVAASGAGAIALCCLLSKRPGQGRATTCVLRSMHNTRLETPGDQPARIHCFCKVQCPWSACDAVCPLEAAAARALWPGEGRTEIQCGAGSRCYRRSERPPERTRLTPPSRRAFMIASLTGPQETVGATRACCAAKV